MILKKETNYISASELLLEVENILSTYHERSLLDNSIYYPVIKRCLHRLGLRALPLNSTVVQIENYQAKLPTDFYKLRFALGCANVIKIQTNENPQVYEVYNTDKFQSYHDDYLLKPNETRVDDCGDEFYVIQRYETFSLKHTEFFPLSISSSSYQSCTSDCINKKQLVGNQIDISNKTITTSFPKGSVYIEYLQSLEQETPDGVELLIPDFAQITNWIVQTCILKGLEKIYLNGEADVQQRLNYILQQQSIAEANAMSFVSRHSVKEFYAVRTQLFSRFKKYNDVVYGKQTNPLYGPYW